MGGGASTIQQCLRAGLAEELHIDIMPVLLGGGQRLFDDLGPEPLQLERIAVLDLPGSRTKLEYRIGCPYGFKTRRSWPSSSTTPRSCAS